MENTKQHTTTERLMLRRTLHSPIFRLMSTSSATPIEDTMRAKVTNF